MASDVTRVEPARVGDWVQVRGVPGRATRRGQITAVLGDARRRRYRVRWDESHESIIYPADGFAVLRQLSMASRR